MIKEYKIEPDISYIIWFSQRTGSTLLCKALEDTGIAGRPNEWLNNCGDIKKIDLKKDLWDKGMTQNGVFGVKIPMYRPLFDNIINLFKQLPKSNNSSSNIDFIDSVLPNCRHIFMTRRNKVRLAVSWLRAIHSGEWHRRHKEKPDPCDLFDKYSYDAINHLYNECSMREAAIQELFDQGDIIPMTIVYEDFIRNYKDTIRDVLIFLGIDLPEDICIQEPYYDKIADEISEAWVQRFREERQEGWTNRGW